MEEEQKKISNAIQHTTNMDLVDRDIVHFKKGKDIIRELRKQLLAELEELRNSEQEKK